MEVVLGLLLIAVTSVAAFGVGALLGRLLPLGPSLFVGALLGGVIGVIGYGAAGYVMFGLR